MSAEHQKRQSLIVDHIQKHPSATQKNILVYLDKQNVIASQATVARDLKELGYKKIGGRYVKHKEKVKSEQETILRSLISHDSPRIIGSSIEVFQIILSTKRGMEQSISELISQVYSENIVGTFVGNGCVMIITTSKKNADAIEKSLKSYRKTS